jgi:hypothetical protein
LAVGGIPKVESTAVPVVVTAAAATSAAADTYRYGKGCWWEGCEGGS